jgi:formate dehydrogenase subunit gamma
MGSTGPKEKNCAALLAIDSITDGSGGVIKSKHAPAGRFNLGEKLVYWLSLRAGIAVSVSGFLLLFPFYGTNIIAMQLARDAARAGRSRNRGCAVRCSDFGTHLYRHLRNGRCVQSLGEVDLNWAKEHHDL